MKNNNFNKKRSILLSRTLGQEKKGQMIVLMGVTLAISVLLMGGLAAKISDLDVAAPQARSHDLLREFIHIKETFGLALNYNLADIDDSFAFKGDIFGDYGDFSPIISAAGNTSNAFRIIELQHDKIFSATLESLDYYNLSDEGHVYHVCISLSLRDEESSITETVTYSIVYREEEYV